MAVDRSELELIWPADLFAAEARALLDNSQYGADSLTWLFAEAFHDDRGARLLAELDHAAGMVESPDLWLTPNPGSRVNRVVKTRPSVQLARDLAADAEGLPRYRPKRYYSARHTSGVPSRLTPEQAKSAYVGVVIQLTSNGYFEECFGSDCGDSDGPDPNIEGQRRPSDLVGSNKSLWPLSRDGVRTSIEEQWSEAEFYDVVEALHDLVARPRWRSWHDFGGDWHYNDFARSPGRAVYRWKVNEVFDRSEVPMRLAEHGGDVGLMVHAVGDPRDELVDQAMKTPMPADRSEVEHAVAQFRGRGATRPAKRSAVVSLAGVLEPRRSLIENQFSKGDEGALFQIANKFHLRHSGADQHPDYDDAYLDWLFWWYLATVELTDQLIARQKDSP